MDTPARYGMDTGRRFLPDTAANTPQLWLRVARIVRPQGHRGAVVAELLTDFPERFETRPQVWLRAREQDDPERTLTVEQFRLHQGRIVLHFAECTSMNEAEALRGVELVVPWEQRTPLPDDELYIAELAGCTLIDSRQQKPVGTIVDVDRELSNTLLLVVKHKEGELLVPFVKAYAPRWNLQARTVHMHLPEGLLDLLEESGAPPRLSDPDADSSD